MRTRVKSGAIAIMTGGAIAVLMLSGCSAATEPAATAETQSPSETARPTSPSPTASEVPEVAASAAVSGVGTVAPVTVDIPIPEGSRSLTLDVTCTGGTDFGVELQSSTTTFVTWLAGRCDGTTSVSWPVNEWTQPAVIVTMAEGVAWEAQPRFSAAEFESDKDITAECTPFADQVYSDISNADYGYRIQEVDEAEWHERIEHATLRLEGLIGWSRSALKVHFEQVYTALTDPVPAPGEASESAVEPLIQITNICNANQSPMTMSGEFGG